MARLQDIDIPYLEFAEAAAPGTPAAAVSRIYVKADGLFYSKDDAGVETLMSSGGAGSVATDAIWDAKGDLAGGTGANTAARLAVGADDTILMADTAQATGLKWVASATGSTQVIGDAATTGTADTFSRGDHKHALTQSYANSDASGDTATFTLDTETDMPGCSISLVAGTWILGGAATFSSGTAVYILAVITDGSNNHIAMGRQVRATGTPVTIAVPVRVVTPGSTTTYKMRVQCGASSGTALRYATGTTPGTAIWATRVA